MSMRPRFAWMVAAAGVLVIAAGEVGQAQPRPSAAPPPDFNGVVRPVLLTRCAGCHGEKVQRGGLRLDQREAALEGGANGPVIVPGDANASRLYQLVAAKKMPLDDELSVLEVTALRDWINGGARWPEPRAIPAAMADARVDEFRQALRNQDHAKIAAALADPTLLKARGRDGSTLLHHVVLFGAPAQAKALLDKGADVNAANLSGGTPLIWAVRDEAMAALLVERGADVNAVSDGGVTPLIAAAGRPAGAGVIKMLLAHGAKPTPQQLPALAAAIATPGELEALQLLFPAVIPVNGLPASIAAGNVTNARCYACLDYLIAQGARGQTLNLALVAAANSGDASLVKRLLGLGATLDGRGLQDSTALIAAAASDIQAAEKIELLIAAGADVNVADAHGRTALTFARDIHPELAPMLIAKGAK